MDFYRPQVRISKVILNSLETFFLFNRLLHWKPSKNIATSNGLLNMFTPPIGNEKNAIFELTF